MHDWPAIFREHGLAPELGSRFRVVQASWMEISVVVYGGEPARTVVTAAPVHESGGVVRPATVTFEPDLCVIRNQPRGPTPSSDRRAVLFGLMSGNVPALNSLESESMQLERPLMCGGPPALPAIVKVSHAHRGLGKIRVDTQTQFRDVATVLALHDEYCTGEPFVEAEYGVRIQKIGSHYRALKKTPTSGNWKSQFGACDLAETVCCRCCCSHHHHLQTLCVYFHCAVLCLCFCRRLHPSTSGGLTSAPSSLAAWTGVRSTPCTAWTGRTTSSS